MQVMSPPRTVAPSYVVPNFKESANVVILCLRLKNEKCTSFSLYSVELYLSLNIIIFSCVSLHNIHLVGGDETLGGRCDGATSSIILEQISK